jgi:uncharacterized membrane protein YedE/YeeE
MAARRAARRGDVLIWLVAGVAAFAVLVSGIGLFTSFFWLQAVSNGSQGGDVSNQPAPSTRQAVEL